VVSMKQDPFLFPFFLFQIGGPMHDAVSTPAHVMSINVQLQINPNN